MNCVTHNVEFLFDYEVQRKKHPSFYKLADGKEKTRNAKAG